MCNEEPKIGYETTYSVKETCAILNISKATLAKRRRRGIIKPVNPEAPARYRYSGKAIRDLWRIENHLPV